MKFDLETIGYYYSKSDKEKLEKLGFVFYEDEEAWDKKRPYAKEYDTEVEIEINTLEELIEFQNKYGGLIINNSYFKDNKKIIEIYDDYRE